jgi:hypothetical protein
MANKRNLTFLKSNYTLRTKHKSLNKKNSDIYVRDYMVTTNNGGWDSGSIPYGESNFKMVRRNDVKQTRKHTYGKWLMNGESDVWTVEDIKTALKEHSNETNSSGKSILTPNYTSLLDFAYFGSCTEMIKSSILNIINEFPGELYVSSNKFYWYGPNNESYAIKDDTGRFLYIVDNPFMIDIFTETIKAGRDDNDKFFCVSRDHYKILDANENICNYEFQRWIVEIEDSFNFKCPKEGYVGKVLLSGDYDGVSIKSNIEYNPVTLADEGNTFIIYIYYYNNKYIYLTNDIWIGYHVRLSEVKIDTFYNEKLDDFERFLLNRDTRPRFLVNLEKHEYTDYGLRKSNETLIWPTIGGWNLDIESPSYSQYLQTLLEMASVFDEYNSNNLLRMMTHDSIKNMDLTFSNDKTNEDVSDYNIGTSRVEGLFWAYGRIFDDIKRYIENMKISNNISYSQKQEIPETILNEKLDLSGWDLYDPTSTLTNVTLDNLFPQQYKSYSLSDVKENFLKILFLNSKDIFSRKGTKYSIEMIMSMFGFCSYDYARNLYPYLPLEQQIYEVTTEGVVVKKWEELTAKEKESYFDYKINEYVSIASNKETDIIDIDDEFPAETYNKMLVKNLNLTDTTFLEDAEEIDTLTGLPVREVVFYKSNGEVVKYLIPWYSKAIYENNKMYFQMYGGWGEVSLKEISERIHIDNEQTIQYTTLNGGDTFKIYSETLKYLKTKNNVSDLLRIPYKDLNEGDIYYINTPYGDEYHYYILVDKENPHSMSGWRPITEEDFENNTTEALKVVYLESIIDENKGNNPHVGYGTYDDGKTYLEYFRQLFKYEIDNNSGENQLFTSEAYNCDMSIIDGIQNCGFKVSDIIKDNMKVWYFTPTVLSYDKEPSGTFVYPSTAGQDITVESGYTINDNSAWRVHCSNYTTDKYHSVIDLYPFEELDENKIYNVSFTVKNTATSTIVVKIKLGKIPGVTSFVSTDVVDSIEMLPNTERKIEFSGYPWPKANLQIWIEPRWTQAGTNQYYPIKYDISKIYLTQTSQIDTLVKNDKNGLYYIYKGNDVETNKVGKPAFEDGQTHYEADFSTFNFETQQLNSNDEAAANSIINVKNLEIDFANKYVALGGFRNYLLKAVMPYVTQVIPSTAILKIGFNSGAEADAYVHYDIAETAGII